MLRFYRESRETAERNTLGAVQLIGDYGGRTYVIREASAVKVSDATLRQLAIDLDAVFEWHFADATDVQWGIVNPWPEWGGSPPFAQGFWIDPRLVARSVNPASVDAVLRGAVPRLVRAR
jgi:hypothetical protein